MIYDGAAITGIHQSRLQSLLAYLILNADAPQSRAYAAFSLWPDTPEANARNNLRQFLYQLRKNLPDPQRFLIADNNTIQWKSDEAQEIDIQQFERRLKEAEALEKRGEAQACCQKLEQAVSIYAGDLLPECYEEWIEPARERLRQEFTGACRKQVHMLEEQRAYDAALQAAQQLLRFDPLDEEAYALLMRINLLREDEAGARRVYQNATEMLKRELGAEPGPSLRRIYERLQTAPRAGPQKEAGKAEANEQTELVGRQAEWQKLKAAWRQATRGDAHLFLITGEAGIGKSRLAEELFTWAARQGFATAYTRSYGAEGRLSLAPVTEWLRSEAIRPYLAKLDPVWLTEIARILPELLSEHPGLARPAPILEYGRRQYFFEALARGILAVEGPLLLWMDDLQWCDQETLEWLHFLLRFEPQSALLILGTARSEESPPDHPLSSLARQLRMENKVATVELAPLDAAETARLASQVRGAGLDERDTLRLFRETEGNPLFVVETVRAAMAGPVMAEPGSSNPVPMVEAQALPPRVQAVILGRLVQLSPQARKVAELGAAIGRAFSLDLLYRASSEDEETLIQALDELWQKRILREQNVNSFDFTHDKLREVAYRETSLPQRRLLHRRIAQALETLHAEDLDPISPLIAAHYEQAGLYEQAVPYYQQAGSVAASVYANEDAINLFSRGLELLGRLPVSVKRDIQELNLQLALATLYRISKGWASPQEERVINRAMVLSDKVGDIEQRIRTLFGLQTLYVVQAQYEKVERTYAQAEKLFLQAQGTPPPFAAISLAGAKLSMGQLLEARALFEKVTAIRDKKHVLDLQESQGMNYLVHGLAWSSHALWCLGYPQLALERAQSAIEYAREFAQPFNQALAITYLALLQTWRASPKTLLACAKEAAAITDKYRAPYYLAWANILLRYAQAVQQPGADHLTRLQEAIGTFREMGARIRLPVYLSFLAEAYLKAGRIEEGLEALEEGLSESLQNNEHWWDAEIYRLRGELMRAQGASTVDIERAFQRAIEIAQAQEAKSLELRAATSLARLWQADSRPAKAKECLAQVYAWFTEGFDTPDLETAQELIAQL